MLAYMKCPVSTKKNGSYKILKQEVNGRNVTLPSPYTGNVYIQKKWQIKKNFRKHYECS